MPQNGFDGPITLGAGITRFLTAVQAEGYTGPLAFTTVTIRNTSGASVYCKRDSAVSDAGAHKGREIPDGESYTWPPMGGKRKRDFYQMYLYSAAGGAVDVDCE